MDTIANLESIFGLLAIIITVAIALTTFIITNRNEHKKMMGGMDVIIKDCQESNRICREDMKQSHKEFVDILKNLIGK